MSILEQLACAQKTNSEVPNQELAGRLAVSPDPAAIQELAANLWEKNPAVANDCIKVLYEIGYRNPALIAPYAGDFLKLLRSKNNRLVWGGMIALSTVAALCAGELYPHVGEIQNAMGKGSVIAVDAGVLALARIAAADPGCNRAVFPFLLEHLRTCRPKEVPQHAEKVLLAVDAANAAEFVAVLEARLGNATPAQLARLKRVLKQAKQRMELS
ncbi:MAG: hypothetical protein ACOYYS_06845 [Chloroflexota bacterium]